MPPEFKEFFWDTDFEKLDIKKNKKFIISRLLTEGNMETFRWIKQTYSKEEIIDTAKTSRRFNPITANFLKILYNLKEEEMEYYINAKNMNYIYKG